MDQNAVVVAAVVGVWLLDGGGIDVGNGSKVAGGVLLLLLLLQCL